MKPAKTMTIAMAMLIMTMTAIQGAPKEEGAPAKNELQLVCSPELESLANKLVNDYSKEHEGTQIQVTPVSDHEVYGNLREGSIALVNKDCLAGLKGEHYFKMVVGRDAIVPLMNDNHPQRDLILENGISAEGFARIFTSSGNITWGEVLGVPDQRSVYAYAPGKACEKEYLYEFLQIEPGNLTGLVIMEPEDMMKKIASDPGAIGFCSLACLMGMEKSEVDAGITLIPVDMDGDGRLEHFEDIYQSSSVLSHGIFVGRFPKTLYSRIYALTAEQPASAGEMAFLEWMINEGQQTLASAGIMELGYGERASRMEHLSGHDQVLANVSVKASPARVYLMVGGLLLLIGILTLVFARITGNRRAVQTATSLLEKGSAAPGGLFFDKSHTWAYMEKNGRVRIGIDDFLQNVTGPVTRVIMKQPGEQIKRGDSFLTLIQNGKRLEINSPVSGVVEEQNRGLANDVSLLNNDPYAAGWVLMVKPLNWISELKSYFMGEPYANWLKTEVTRLKEFLTSTLKLQDTKEHAVVLQDGGEISGGVLESFGPEVWEEFQDGFINRTK